MGEDGREEAIPEGSTSVSGSEDEEGDEATDANFGFSPDVVARFLQGYGHNEKVARKAMRTTFVSPPCSFHSDNTAAGHPCQSACKRPPVNPPASCRAAGVEGADPGQQHPGAAATGLRVLQGGLCVFRRMGALSKDL